MNIIMISERSKVKGYIIRFSTRLTSYLSDINNLHNLDSLNRESKTKFNRNLFSHDD